MNRRTRTFLLAGIAVLTAPLAAAYLLLRASLPQLDGKLTATDLHAPVTIERDALGIPTISGTHRADVAHATGFVHGQDRFFQMDLSRRLAAGELAELFGEVAVEQDSRTRLFRFRHVARQVLARMTPEQRELIEAYARGVNAGLESLRSRPWEYWVLRAEPVPWREEDSILVVYAMWWDLQANGFRREMLKRRVDARLGGPVCEAGWKCALRFFYPEGTEWDAPNGAGGASPEASSGAIAIPTPEQIDVRAARVTQTRDAAERGASIGNDGSPRAANLEPFDFLHDAGGEHDIGRDRVVGSNSWAVAGALTASGAALVAGDMHLGLRVPAVWYRARLRVGEELDVSGVMLPGTPIIVAGSNRHVAWAFTNSYGDWLDVEPQVCSNVTERSMQTPQGEVSFDVVREEIRVRDGESVVLPVRSTPSGLLVAVEPWGSQEWCWFGRWLAQVPEATNLELLGMERVRAVREALALGPRIGIPHQNFVAGDRAGHIGWTIFGRIPMDVAAERMTGRTPWSTRQEHPAIIDPPVGRIWTANARVTDDPQQLRAIGADEAPLGAEYDVGARAGQIRDGLLALQGGATPRDMLNLQLDDRGLFVARWREQLLLLLDDAALQGHPLRAEFRQLVADWNARASVDSVGYRLVRHYQRRVEHETWHMILRALGIADPEARVPAQFEGGLWQLVTQQPLHMLAPDYASWRDFLLAQVDGAIVDLQASCEALSRCTWGQYRPAHVRHSLSGALPFLSRALDMSPRELPGDHDMPRVQDGAFGASQRFGVSPGKEEEGYLHIPGGQSGHPLSRYYKAGFEAWVKGEATSFLPGPAEHTLTLGP